jgi:hypothetical protein
MIAAAYLQRPVFIDGEVPVAPSPPNSTWLPGTSASATTVPASSPMSYSSSPSRSLRLLSALPTGGTDLLRLSQFLHILGKAGLEIDDFGPGWRDAN